MQYSNRLHRSVLFFSLNNVFFFGSNLFQQCDLILLQINRTANVKLQIWYDSCLLFPRERVNMLTISQDYFCAKGPQVNYSKFLHLNKSVGGGKPFVTSFYSLSAQLLKIISSIQGRYMGSTKLNIHYIFTVPLLKRDFFFLFFLLIPERDCKRWVAGGLPLPGSTANISKWVARHTAS